MTCDVSFHLSEQRMMPWSFCSAFSATLGRARGGLTLLLHHLREGFKPRRGSFVYLLMDLTKSEDITPRETRCNATGGRKGR